LPQDEFSTENAIMLENSERWSLMIDPQMQANLWLKQKHRSKDDTLKAIKPNMPQATIVRTLETSIIYGHAVIFEDATETFDPMLDPLLAKQVEKKGKETVIKFGDKMIGFSDEFQFYVTTKMSSPHYSPEVCVKVTLLNFMVTPDGLLDQMLNEIIRIEEAKQYERRKVCVTQKAENARKIAEIQDQILNAIANTSEDILEDTSLKEVLDQSKESQAQIEQANNETMNAMK
jgi:dynein heavy chain